MCEKEWTEQDGVSGYKFTGPNGNSIFLPAAGMRVANDVTTSGTEGYYLTGTVNPSKIPSKREQRVLAHSAEREGFIQFGICGKLPVRCFCQSPHHCPRVSRYGRTRGFHSQERTVRQGSALSEVVS